MRNITLAIREVVEWYFLGISLNIDRHKLDEIRINRQNNPQHCKVSLQYMHVWYTLYPLIMYQPGSFKQFL